MQKGQTLEPGFLQVFRLFAWLRLAALSLIPLAIYRFQVSSAEAGIPPQFVDGDSLLVPGIVMAFNVIILLLYLYWPQLQRKMGRTFAFGAIVLATGSLLLEQQLLNANQFTWQLSAFMYILLILVAWQYNFRQVVIFTAVTAAAEALVNILFPVDLIFLGSQPELERFLIYGLLVMRSISFLVLGYVVTRLVRAQREQRLALAQANQKLVRHAATLEHLATSRERIRLSRELHDTLAHTLSALAVQIDAVMAIWEPEPEKARATLDQMLDTTRSGLDETRRALSALRASPLEEMGLALALGTMVEDFAARNALALDLEIPENLDDFPPEVEQCFYRVAQEALENIARHAQAGSILVRLEHDPNRLSLLVADDGVGFDPSQSLEARQLGLKGMRERAELIGASLQIESQVGEGVKLRLSAEVDR